MAFTIQSISNLFSWRSKPVTQSNNEVTSDNAADVGNAKKLRDIAMETQKIKQETEYIKETGNPPPKRSIFNLY